MCSVNQRIERLKRETSDLRKEVKDLKDTLLQQTELIINLLSQPTGGMFDDPVEPDSSTLTALCDKEVWEFSSCFPLKTFEDLNNFEMEINEYNKVQIVDTIKNLMRRQGLSKNITNILSDNIIMEMNMDGHHYKTRFLNYPKTIDVLFLARRQHDDCTYKMFLDELRRTLRVVKNRCHKNNCRARQKLLLSEENGVTSLPHQSVKKKLVVKTEETYFPPCSS